MIHRWFNEILGHCCQNIAHLVIWTSFASGIENLELVWESNHFQHHYWSCWRLLLLQCLIKQDRMVCARRLENPSLSYWIKLQKEPTHISGLLIGVVSRNCSILIPQSKRPLLKNRIVNVTILSACIGQIEQGESACVLWWEFVAYFRGRAKEQKASEKGW